ncbi:MAG: sodium:calcium antiporter [Nitrospirae bacterium]|nr:sodium:calcium antiporter [Nitrospirota bacterium]
MLSEILFLILGLLIILVSAEFFTNGIEALGKKFSLSQAVVGSILAAVGTALPETILPMVAIFFYAGKSAKEIGVGAILGAPFMLSTIAMFLVGITVTIAYLRKKRKFELKVEYKSTVRDLIFFLAMYSFAVSLPAIFGRSHIFLVSISIILICGYIFYIYRTLTGESGNIEHSEEIYLVKLMKYIGFSGTENPSIIIILLQVIGALSIMIKGAHTFVESLEYISIRFGMDPLIFALLLAPVATELPEKFNSVTWTWKGRDTLALGNITGAMVFQSTFPVSVGLLFTEWKITGMALLSAIFAITSSIIMLTELNIRKRLSPLTLIVCGSLYFLYAILLVSGNII